MTPTGMTDAVPLPELAVDPEDPQPAMTTAVTAAAAAAALRLILIFPPA
jgi:hypothetical protein